MKTSAPFSTKVEEIRPGYFRAIVFGTARRDNGSTYEAVEWVGESVDRAKLERLALRALNAAGGVAPRKRFKESMLQSSYAGCFRAYEIRHSSLFTKSGTPMKMNGIAAAFWRGYMGHDAGVVASPGTVAWACYRAGQDVRRQNSEFAGHVFPPACIGGPTMVDAWGARK